MLLLNCLQSLFSYEYSTKPVSLETAEQIETTQRNTNVIGCPVRNYIVLNWTYKLHKISQ